MFVYKISICIWSCWQLRWHRRWLIWFNIPDQMGITCPRQVVKICDKAVLDLKEHCSKKGESRFTNLLLRLSPLRSLQPDVLEELFFAGLIGNVQIDSVVPYILKMESSEYKVSQQQNISSSATGNENIHLKNVKKIKNKNCRFFLFFNHPNFFF